MHNSKKNPTATRRRLSSEETFAQNRFPGSFFHAIQKSFDELTQSLNNVLSIEQQEIQTAQF